MRSVIDKEQFTPFGLWIRQYLKKSGEGLSVTNLDYVVEDFKRKKVLLLEEKQNAGQLHKAQMLTFKVIDRCLTMVSPRWDYEYWGFYILQFPKGCTMPGPGTCLNGEPINADQLQKHLNFEVKFCDPLTLNVDLIDPDLLDKEPKQTKKATKCGPA